MTTSRQDQINVKIARTFQTLDGNQNGYLEWSNFESLANRFLTAYNLDKNDRRARALFAWRIAVPEAMESFSKVDTDGDGVISRQEFIRATREYFHSTDPHGPRRCAPTTAARTTPDQLQGGDVVADAAVDRPGGAAGRHELAERGGRQGRTQEFGSATVPAGHKIVAFGQ
ncbi:EF-hand domain-containing protein [Actinokineospora iranica]|uniref:EF-hand domain pair n=1 Tax=Actinokineospora iranica TaxID=1271860 RepID=A0A1G6P3G6_9PSEU|nr:EF-hand domain-containing protein [Actinokineospora iranica]SDC74558.1 EF-hand domain pair [Actinokineospora iranica]